LLKISEDKRDTIIAKLKQDIDAANAYYEETIEPAVMERYAIFHADKDYYRKMFPRLSKRCEITSTDVQDTIESTMPVLMKTFFGSTDVVTIQGADGTDEDSDRAEKMQELINYELQQNKFFVRFYRWAKDALITNLGIIKVDWDREYKEVQKTITMDAEAYAQYRPQAEAMGIKVNAAETNPAGGINVTYTAQELAKNRPRVMNLMASEFRFSPDATRLEDADFVAHRKIVSIDYLRMQGESGMYQNVEEVAQKAVAPHYTTLDTQNNEYIDEQPNRTDTGRQKVELYECYVNLNMSDDPDGRLTPMIVTVSNGVILRCEENTYERNPFFVLSPRIDPHHIWPETGFTDLIAQVQHSKTAIIRQMIYNIAQGNDSKMAIDTAALVDINDVLNNAQFIRVKGNVSEALQPLPAAQLQSWTFNMLEYLDTVKENRTGITKYNQGLDSNSLNKTATGISIITQQSNQRLELIARIFAETGLTELFRFLIKLNQLFINEDLVIRLTNGPLKIDPSDLDGSFDLIVNAGMGAGAKQTNLQNLQMVRELSTQLAEVGLSGPQQWYNLAKRIIEEVGFKNVDDFIIDPSAVAAQMPQQGEQEAAGEDSKTTIRSAITDAPWQVQMQFWQKLGFEVTPQMFTEQAAQKVLSSAADAQAKADASRGDAMHDRLQQANLARPRGGGRMAGTTSNAGAQAGGSTGALKPASQYNGTMAGNAAGSTTAGVSSY
jgi:hypothetical protein